MNSRRRRGGGALALHAAILEPHLHLALAQLQRDGDLVAAQPRQVARVGELLLQFGDLRAREGGALFAIELLAGDGGVEVRRYAVVFVW